MIKILNKSDYKKYIINPNIKLSEIISKLNKLQNKCLIIVTKEKISGTITDADIRRKILHLDINSTAKDFCNKNPKIIKFSQNLNLKVINFFEKYLNLDLVPIYKNNKLYKIAITSKNYPIKNDNNFQCLVLAGGFGNRIKKFTKKIPKPFLKINKNPYIVDLINKLLKFNCSKIYLSFFYKKKYCNEIINAKFKNELIGKKIKIINENVPLGTAGSLSYLKSLKNQNILVLNSDILFNFDINSFFKYHVANKNVITIAVAKHEIDIPFGVINYKNNKIHYVDEKPKKKFIINKGIYFVNSKVLSLIKLNKYLDMTDLINLSLKKKFKIDYYVLNEAILDYGSYENLEIAKKNFNKFF